MEALLPSADDPTGQESNSHSSVRVVAGASDEPGDITESEVFGWSFWHRSGFTSPRLVLCRCAKYHRVSCIGQSCVEHSDVLLSPAVIIGKNDVSALDSQREKSGEQSKKMHLDGKIAWKLCLNINRSNREQGEEEEGASKDCQRREHKSCI